VVNPSWANQVNLNQFKLKCGAHSRILCDEPQNP
jgi:hypothetical protein